MPEPQLPSIGRSSAQCAFAAALLSLLLVTQQVGTPTSVVVVVEGVPHRTVTAQRTVGGVLTEMGLDLHDALVVDPAPDTPVTPDLRITVRRLRPLVITLPDREVPYDGAARTAAAALADLGLVLGPQDRLRVASASLAPHADLTPLRSVYAHDQSALVARSPLRIEGVRAARNSLRFDRLEPVRIVLERAVPVVVHDQGQAVTFATHGASVREALAEAGVAIRPGDLVRPDPETPVRPGVHVYLERARTVVLTADRATRIITSRVKRVEQVLQEQGITLERLDRVAPALGAPLYDGMPVQVVRVREEQVVEEEVVPFEIERIPTDELQLGETHTLQPGNPGLTRRYYRVRIEDGEEVARELTATQVSSEPRTHRVQFGTRAPTVMTPEGPKAYTRKLRVWATWYNASHGGKSPDSPWYGVTALGLRATYGVMAVDPRVIPFWTRAYVPGYGIAVAGDTGGGIRGYHIDLAFDEGVPVTWGSRYVDIYLLGSPTLQDALRAAFPDE